MHKFNFLAPSRIKILYDPLGYETTETIAVGTPVPLHELRRHVGKLNRSFASNSLKQTR